MIKGTSNPFRSAFRELPVGARQQASGRVKSSWSSLLREFSARQSRTAPVTVQGLLEPAEMAAYHTPLTRVVPRRIYTPLPLDLQEAKAFFVTSPACGNQQTRRRKNALRPSAGAVSRPTTEQQEENRSRRVQDHRHRIKISPVRKNFA